MKYDRWTGFQTGLRWNFGLRASKPDSRHTSSSDKFVTNGRGESMRAEPLRFGRVVCRMELDALLIDRPSMKRKP
jgi:hypothetical protein